MEEPKEIFIQLKSIPVEQPVEDEEDDKSDKEEWW